LEEELFFVGLLWSLTKRAGSISQRHGFADPDPYQNVTDPQHSFFVSVFKVTDEKSRIRIHITDFLHIHVYAGGDGVQPGLADAQP
jgi:hypothetical protein